MDYFLLHKSDFLATLPGSVVLLCLAMGLQGGEVNCVSENPFHKMKFVSKVALKLYQSVPVLYHVIHGCFVAVKQQSQDLL